MSVGGGYRIGEFARRVGVTPELLRAWEQRYGLLRPVRTPGGFRLYGEEDAERVARMRQGLDEGLSAAEAARMALEPSSSPDGLIEDARARLIGAIESYDEAGVQGALDDGLAAFGLEAFVRDLILPTLTVVGRGWEQGTVDISQEHFASNLIRGRLLSLARLWGRGAGPLALLACAPGEQHDISLLAFGLILRSHGWRILYLGADTPLSTLEDTARTTGAAVVVLVTFDAELVNAEGATLRRLARTAPLRLSGPGASPDLTGQLRVRRLDGDLIEAAHEVANMTNR
ncbi:MAG TPA: MerR family transcriptional regulator [Solirubrobacteraceae bacterium]|nr:MerR family transcriptional regulator [Solirubrobacteraceae bacterium]